MKPLSNYRQVLMWLCICPTDETVSKHQKMLCVAFSVFFNASSLSFIVASLTYFIESSSTDMGKLFFTFLQTIGVLGEMYMMAIAFILRQKITAMFDHLSEISETSKYTQNQKKKKHLRHNCQCNFSMHLDKNSDSFRFLAQTNKMCDWMWHIYFKYVLIGIIFFISIICIISVLISSMLNGSLNIYEHLFHPHQIM